MRFYEYESRKIVERAAIPVTKYGFCKTPQEARAAAERDRRLGGGQVPGADRRADEGRRRQVRRQPGGGGGARGGDPRAGDQRADAARRAGRPEGGGRAGVLRGRRLGRDPQAADDAVQRHGRDRHRGGRRAPPRTRWARPPLQPSADLRFPGQAGDRADRRHRVGAQPRDADPRPAGSVDARLRHDPRRDQPPGPPRGRQLRGPRRPHGDGGRGQAAPAACSPELGIGDEELASPTSRASSSAT